MNENLKEAIRTISQECRANNACENCPLEIFCFNMSSPASWLDVLYLHRDEI